MLKLIFRIKMASRDANSIISIPDGFCKTACFVDHRFSQNETTSSGQSIVGWAKARA
jgi:hypothetical protein